MTQHDDRITLRQMLNIATEAVEFSKGRLWCLAMERLVLNVGEASNRLSDTTQQQLPQIPWAQIAAFRNRVVHGYDSVDYNRVWQILRVDVPSLIRELEKLDLPEFE